MADPLRLIAGLGNPGSGYLRTRHNVGFWLVDRLALEAGARFALDSRLRVELARIEIAGQPVTLLKPMSFMNASGAPVAATLRYFRIEPEQMLVVHDDLDLPPGTARLKYDGGHGGQNGLRDLFRHVGHGRFHRLRLGIGHPGHRDQVTPWVLGRPTAGDEAAILRAMDEALAVLPLAVAGNVEEAMKRLHTGRPERERPPPRNDSTG